MQEFLRNFDLTTLDGTMILVWAAMFFVIWQLLASYLFRPYLRLIEKRESLTSGATAVVAERQKLADDLTNEYEQKLLDHKVSLMKRRAELLAVAKTEAQQILSASEGEAQSMVAQARDRIQSEIIAISKTIPHEAGILSDLLVQNFERSLGEIRDVQ